MKEENIQEQQIKELEFLVSPGRTPHASHLKLVAMRFVFFPERSDTISDIAKRVGVSRTHFSREVLRVRRVSLLERFHRMPERVPVDPLKRKRDYMNRLRRSNPEKYRGYQRGYYQKNKETMVDRQHKIRQTRALLTFLALPSAITKTQTK